MKMKNLFLLQLFLFIANVNGDCSEPLGMESGTIKNSQITAPHWLYYKSVMNSHYTPYLARLNVNSSSGAWCSEDKSKVKNQYIEIDLLRNKRITGIATQGRHGSTEYVEAFKILYQRDYEKTYRKYLDNNGGWKIFEGNWDSITIKKLKFLRSIIARRIRIYPVGNEFSISCMRLELYGCKWSQAEAGLLSYTSPYGSPFSGINMRDTTYDGKLNKNKNMLSDGVGKLTDDIYGNEKLSVNNDSPWIAFNTERPVITFRFNKERIFEQVIMDMNKISKTENLFEKVEILKSSDGANYTHVKYHLPSSREYFQREGRFAVVVNVGQIRTKYIRLIFTKSSKWLLISEVTFLSEDEFVDVFTPEYPKFNSFTPTESEVNGRSTDSSGTDTTGESKDSKGDSSVKQLSFPIILTITLVTLIAAVLVVIFILKTYKKKQKGKCPESIEKSKQKQLEQINNTQTFIQPHAPMKTHHTNSLLYDENARLAFQYQQQKLSQNNGCVNAPLLQEGLYVYPVPQQQVYNNAPVYDYVSR